MIGRGLAAAFSLIELAMVLAVLAVLTSLAIPRLHDAMARAQRAEVFPQLEGIMTQALAYEQAHDSFPPACSWHPHPDTIGSKLRLWQPAPSDWAEHGYDAGRAVRGTYGYMSQSLGDAEGEVDFANAATDLDQDGQNAYTTVLRNSDGQMRFIEGCWPVAADCL